MKPSDASTTPGPCPPEQAWIDLASGAASAAESETLMLHAATCKHCVLALREAIAIVEGLPAIESAAPHEHPGDTSLARKMAVSGRRNLPALGGFFAIAAALAIGFWFLLARDRGPMPLLAQAYTARRSVELRVPGAPYAPLRAERGASSQSPAELLEAQALVKRKLDKEPGNTAFLHAQGRVYLLDWQYQPALAALQDAADRGLDNADLWIDLATAYFERGEADHAPADYSKAVEYLTKAIRERPQDPVALFNRGVVHARLFLVSPAIEDFEAALRLEQDAEWRREIESRLAAVRQLKVSLVPGTVSPQEPPSPEVAFEAALRNGVAAASTELDARMLQLHGDRWLRDVRLLPHAFERPLAALSQLARVRNSIAVQDYQQFEPSIRELQTAALPPPLAAWRGFELLYRASHGSDLTACPALAAAPLHAYAWFEVQTLLEQSTCDLRADLAASDRRTEAAVERASAAGLRVSLLRARGFQSSHLINQGRYREALRLDIGALAELSAGGWPALRVNQFYNDLMRAFDQLGRIDAAAGAAAMNAEVAQSLGLHLSELVARGKQAEYAAARGLDAAPYLNRMDRLLASIGSGGTAAEPAFAQVGLYEARRDRPALENLRRQKQHDNPFLQGAIALALARLDLAAGDAASTAALADYVFRGSGIVPTGPGSRQWRRDFAEAARLRVEARLALGDTAAAWTAWQDYLRADRIALGGALLHPVLQSRANPCTLLTIAPLGARVAVWTSAGGPPAFRWASASTAQLGQWARILRRLCSNPRTPSAEVEAASARIRRALLPDENPQLALAVQAAQELNALPLHLVFGHAVYGSCAAFAPEARYHSALIARADLVHNDFRSKLPPLPSLDEEVMAVRAAFPRSQSISGIDVTAQSIVASGFDLLHFAGHSMRQADGVALVVAPRPKSADAAARLGLFHLGAALPFRIAVFSACSTASYEDYDTVGPAMLAEAASLSGVPQVAAALWDVDSSATSRLMKEFYARLSGDSTAASAIWEAARVVRSLPEYSHPYFWASFALYGPTP